LAIALLLAAPLRAQQAQPAGPPQQVSGPEMSILIRSAIVALDQANVTGNYTVLRDLGASAMQTANTAADLANLFANYRKQNFSLADTVLLDPVLDEKPQLSTDGALHLVGHFPTRPQEIMFDMTFFYERDRWRVANMQVGSRVPTENGRGSGATASNSPAVPLPRLRPAP
jgi:hypothetical protein